MYWVVDLSSINIYWNFIFKFDQIQCIETRAGFRNKQRHVDNIFNVVICLKSLLPKVSLKFSSSIRCKHFKAYLHDNRSLGNTKFSPPSSSESDMNVSCISSGACTRYFSSMFVVVVVVMVVVVVTTFRVSITVM